MAEPSLVSIVLPTHNGARYLAEAIESCLKQSYRNIELIIVDDASTDRTPAIIREYVDRDSRVRSIRHKLNKRLPGALNTGFVASRGQYLTWTSDDNVYESDAIVIMLEHLQRHPEVGLVYTDNRKIDADGNDLGPWLFDDPEALSEMNCVQACFLYRRNVYATVGEYDPGMFLVEDWDYWIRVSKAFRIDHLAGCMPYRYRRHDQSLTTKRRWQVAVQIGKLKTRHFNLADYPGQYLGRYFCDLSWHFQNGGEVGLAWRAAIRCLLHGGPRWLHVKRLGALVRHTFRRGSIAKMPIPVHSGSTDSAVR